MSFSAAAKVVTAVAVVVFVLGGFGPTTQSDERLLDQPSSSVPRQMSTGEAISFFADRVTASPGDALSATVLSELQTKRARETGDIGEFTRAMSSAEQALDRLPDYAPAHLALARAQLALHRFTDAEASAETAADLDPDLGAEVVVADVAIATGDVDRADQIYARLGDRFDSPALEARIARVSELRGDYDTAIARMETALARAEQLDEIAGEPAAWLHLRRGDLAFATGDYDGAEDHYRESLDLFSPYPAAEAGLARTLAAQGRFEEAAEAYEHSIEIQPIPDVLLAASRMYQRIGDFDSAARHRATLNAIAQLSDGVYDLAQIHHLVDEGQADQALVIAERQSEGRTDAYSLDALGWAQHHAGDRAGAVDTMSRVLDSGIADAKVLFHAGVILWDIDRSRAADLIERALSTSAEFDPIDAPRARQLLDAPE